ncbi:hypothetical protein [Salinibius halmophilus]|uniref:hypothetical protein n=1 Tax=Salinibius halmophilus TaxID=1853216 RepID=UPI000E671095|nr:hypothetical protein [Salinibius halmophilus]
MLPELSLSWRFVKPLRALLAFLIILLASFMAIALMYWQTAQDYRQNVPSGVVEKNYFTVGFDAISELGRIDECTVDQINDIDGITSSMVELEMLYDDQSTIIGDTRTLALVDDQIQTVAPNFLDFFGIEPTERFFDHRQLYQERWVYVNETWWQQNQHLAKERNGYLSLEVAISFMGNGEELVDTQVLPIAGILPGDFHPYQSQQQPAIIASNGLSYWHPEEQYNGFVFEPPRAPGSRSYWWARLLISADNNTSLAELETRINQTLLESPAPCVRYLYAFRNMKLLPGSRMDLAEYEKQGESVSLLTLVVIALGIIVCLYTLALAQRLQSVRQQEFLLKIAMGGSPKRIAMQILAETSMFAVLALVLAVVVYLPLNHFADAIGFVSTSELQLTPWLILLGVVFAIGFYLVMASRKVADPEYVYQGLTNLRHKIQHKFWWLQLNHAIYLVVLAVAVLIMGLISTAYWRQLMPNDVMSKTDYQVVVQDWQMTNGEVETLSEFYPSEADVLALLRDNRDRVALQCGNYDVQGMQLKGANEPPVNIVNSVASDSFFEHVLDLGPIEGRQAFITPDAAKALNISSDMRDLADVRIANVPGVNAEGRVVLRGSQGIQRVLPEMNMPNLASAPIMYKPLSVPTGTSCFSGVLWVAPDFDKQLIDNLEMSLSYAGKDLGYRLLSWQEYMALEQEVAVQRLRLVLVLSALAMVSLFAIVLLNTSYLFKHMQPWYWLNIAQGMPPRVAKIQTQLRIGVLSAIALVTALVIAVFGFYEFFPLVSQWLPRRDALNLAVIATVLILVVQQVSLWWCARTLNNKDLSVWQS